MVIRELIVKLGLDSAKAEKGLKNVDGSLQSVTKSGFKLGIGFAAAQAAANAAVGAFNALKDSVVDAINEGDELGKLARALGVTATQLKAIQQAGEKAGAPLGELNSLMGKLSGRVKQAAEGQGNAAKAFEQLGINARNQDGSLKNVRDVLFEVQDKFKDLESSTEKAAISMLLFEETGPKFINFLEAGSEGIKEQEKLIAKLTGGALDSFTGLSEDAANKMADFNNKLQLIGFTILSKVLPAINKLLDFASDMVSAINESDLALSVIKISLITLGSIAAVAFLAALPAIAAYVAGMVSAAAATLAAAAPFIAIGVAIAALILIIDDIMTFFEGGDSVTGRVVDAFKEMFPGVSSALGTIRDVVGTVFSFIGSTVLKLVNLWKANFNLIVAAIHAVWRLLEPFKVGTMVIFEAIGKAIDFVAEKLAPVINAFKTANKVVGSFLSKAGGVIGGFIGNAIDGAAAGTNAAADALNGVGRKAGGGGTQITNANKVNVVVNASNAAQAQRGVQNAIKKAQIGIQGAR